jgi:glycosyltransferase involved in cell wall biosynthesis
MSVGMKAYARELSARLPQVAPDLEFVPFVHGANFGWSEHVTLPISIRKARPALTHFLSLYTPAIAPRPYAITIHDLIHLRFPQYFKSKVGPYYRTVVRFACSRAARIITDDERTIGDLERFLGVDPARVRVIPLGAGDVYFRPVEPYRPPRPYIMYAGNHRAHKDLPTLFEAWARLPSDIALDLYVTGVDDFGELHMQYARSEGRIIAVGDLGESLLASYYAGARAYVHPALCEGFGLPILEAMAAGCPVIACEDAVPSVLRDASLTFPARDVRAASEAMEALLRDEGLRRKHVDQGQARARRYTWDRCAVETAGVYRQVLEEQWRR